MILEYYNINFASETQLTRDEMIKRCGLRSVKKIETVFRNNPELKSIEWEHQGERTFDSRWRISKPVKRFIQ